MNDLGLPSDVGAGLAEFVEEAKSALGPDLVSIVLFGSAAEAKMRATSDVNLMLVLARFDEQRVNAMREPTRTAHALIRLECMFILQSELADATEAFAVKFADIHGRHKVLFGADPFRQLQPTAEAMRFRLRQVLLNWILRAREHYVLSSLREEQLAPLIADAAGPLRAAAEIMLTLEGRPATSPKAALELLGSELGDARWNAALASLSQARETGALPPGAARGTLLALIALAEALRSRTSRAS